MERTLDHALSPELYLNDVVKRYGMNLRGTRVVFDPTLPPGKLGTTRAAERGMVIRVGPDALAGEATVANTLAHELSHARDYRRGMHKAHGNRSSLGDRTAYGAGNALEDYINGNR
jgi:hypothetical protein